MNRLIVIFLAFAGPAFAQAGGGEKVKQCYCTDTAGSRVEMGEQICLYVDGRAFIARCEMSLNNPMWRDTGQSCVSSGLLPGASGTLQSIDPAADTGPVYPKI